jgi:hypothetical protein
MIFMVLKKSNTPKIRFKNLPQADILKKSNSYKTNISVFNNSLNRREKLISENLSSKINKKNTLQNITFLKKITFKSDMNVLNPVNVAYFSRDFLSNYLREINGKHNLKLKVDSLFKPEAYIKEIYKSKKITLEERVNIKFLLNFAKKSHNLKNKFKEFNALSKEYLETNLSSLEKSLFARMNKEIDTISRDKRISSQEAKEAREAKVNIEKYYKSIFESKKNTFLENQKKLIKLNSEIISLLPEVIASADLIEYIKKKEFQEQYNKLKK